MNKRNFKAFLAVLLTVVMVFSIVPLSVSAAGVKYTFSDYAAGTQYAMNEEHVLDDVITVTTSDAHFTTQLRLYDSSAHDGIAVITSTKVIESVILNAGNKAATLNVYGSTDGSNWTLVKGVTTTTSYTDYTVDMPANTAYTYLKLDADGDQIRVAYMTITFGEGGNAGGNEGGNEGGETPDVPGTTDTPSTPTDEVTATQITSADQLVTGKYVIATTTNVAMTVVDGTWIRNTSVTPVDGKLTDVAANMIWTITVDGTSATLTDSNGVSIAPIGGNTNGLATSAYKWAVSFADGAFKFAGTGTDTVVLASNKGSSGDFRGYKNETASGNANGYPSNFNLYKIDSTDGGETPAPDAPVVPATLAEQIAAANALADGAYLPYESTITGTITNDPKASSYTEGSYDFTVSDGTNSVRCYFVPVTGGTPAKGDTVTVTGKLTAYKGSAQFDETAAATITEKAEVEVVTFPFKDGDSFAIYYPAGGSVIGTLPSGKKLSAVEATLADGKITRKSGMAEFTADFITDTVFCLIVDGKYLTSGATGNSLTLEDEISDYAGWTLEEAANGWYIKNVNAVFNGGAQYIEFYSGFTTYGLNTSKADIYTYNFYALEGTVEDEEVVIYETPKEIVDAAYGLEDGQILSAGHKYTLTGVITSVDDAYSEQYKNVTVTIVVDGMTDKPIKVYRLAGEGADVIKVGDAITVTGVIKNYNGTIEFDQGCTLDSYTAAAPDQNPDSPATGDATVVVIAAVVLAGAALVVVSRKRRFN